MPLWNAIGDFLDCSDWTIALCEADVATAGKQKTALVLTKLQQEAWECIMETNGDVQFDE